MKSPRFLAQHRLIRYNKKINQLQLILLLTGILNGLKKTMVLFKYR